MTVTEITSLANGDTSKEVALLEEQVEKGSANVEIYFKLSKLYTAKGNYYKAWSCLQNAEKILAPNR
jgi:hypothetical protein